MTIIVYRDGVIAADTLVCAMGRSENDPGIRVGHGPKLHRVKGGIAAYLGGGADSRAAVDWLNGDEGDPPPNLKNGGVIFFPDEGEIMMVTEEGASPIDFEAPYLAWGAGDHVALAAMWMGADAAKAVECAIHFSPYCGGTVQTMRHGGAS